VDNIRDPEVGEPQSSLNQIEKIVRKSVTLRDGGFSWLPEAEAAEPEDASYVFQGHRPPPNSTVHQRPFPPQHRFDFPSHEHHGRSGRRVREGRKSKPGVQCMMNEKRMVGQRMVGGAAPWSSGRIYQQLYSVAPPESPVKKEKDSK
jgi:hypothetical protein